jgi:DNA-binding transcriptional ArsR family regulator
MNEPARDMDKVFKALADPSRRRLLDRLFERDGLTLTVLVEGLGMTRQAVSQHLALLIEADLVVALKAGRERLHFLNPVPIQQIGERWIEKFEKRRLRALLGIKARLEGESRD